MPSTIWFAPWTSGPAAASAHEKDVAGAATVSVTEFTPHHPWTALGVNVAGAVLRRSWRDVTGALGLWLWVDPDPRRPRSGSVSVWRDGRDLKGFVARHDHVRVMRSYRDRGTMRSALWETESFDAAATQEAIRSFLSGRSPWPRDASTGGGRA
ncbi:hypothetical protein ACFWZ2_13965 [Streptomyces sp. NPDC059002]|uniref:hypothetical protein n=1 Tax=Streptomyces sp. NPDC059002 TaxID=3346690 RepID=UPI00367A3FE5